MSQVADQREWVEDLMAMAPLSEREKTIALGAMSWKGAEIDEETFRAFDDDPPEEQEKNRTLSEFVYFLQNE